MVRVIPYCHFKVFRPHHMHINIKPIFRILSSYFTFNTSGFNAVSTLNELGHSWNFNIIPVTICDKPCTWFRVVAKVRCTFYEFLLFSIKTCKANGVYKPIKCVLLFTFKTVCDYDIIVGNDHHSSVINRLCVTYHITFYSTVVRDRYTHIMKHFYGPVSTIWRQWPAIVCFHGTYLSHFAGVKQQQLALYCFLHLLVDHHHIMSNRLLWPVDIQWRTIAIPCGIAVVEAVVVSHYAQHIQLVVVTVKASKRSPFQKCCNFLFWFSALNFWPEHCKACAADISWLWSGIRVIFK